MKKLIALALILVMLFPAAVMAADRDPIIGGWYMFFDSAETPEVASNFSGYDRIFSVYDFLDNGTIMILEADIKNNMSTPVYLASGKWSNENGTYHYSITGLGENTCYIKDNAIFLRVEYLSARPFYMKLRRMEYYDPYGDYVYN